MTDTRMDQDLLDRLAIRAVVENWAVWRDAGDWERFASVWHDLDTLQFLTLAANCPAYCLTAAKL